MVTAAGSPATSSSIKTSDQASRWFFDVAQTRNFTISSDHFHTRTRKHTWLVVSTPLKNMKVSWDDDIPNIWEIIKFHGSKAPTRYRFQPPKCHHFWQHLCQATGATGGRLTTSPAKGDEFPHPNVPMLGLGGKQGFVSQGTMGYNGYYMLLLHVDAYCVI